MTNSRAIPSVEAEYADVELPDARLDERLKRVAARLGAAPSQGFPRAMISEAEVEGLYRLLSNPRVIWVEILAPHLGASASRCAEAQDIFIAHDTSEFLFRGDAVREGLGYLQADNQGFLGHFALGMTGDEERVPLGILGVSTVFRKRPEKLSAVEQRKRSRALAPKDRESARWGAMVEEVEARLPAGVRAVHAMDREADDYRLMCELVANKRGFVIRAAGDRTVFQQGSSSPHRLQGALGTAEDVFFREVPLGKRNPRGSQAKKNHPERHARMAKLHVRAVRVSLGSSQQADLPDVLEVNVLQVFEPSRPLGEPPLSWTLMTTEPIDTPEQRARVVDCYRGRWRIEEFFKALKTGCAYEKRQLESAHALLNTLALLVPIAWRLLALRHLAEKCPQASAELVATPDEIKLLRAISKRVKIPEAPSVETLLQAIAGLGGHLRRNGPPGWLTLGRGYETLFAAYMGWRAAKEEM